RARTSWLSTAAVGARFGRRSRPCHLRLSPARQMGRGRAVARSRPAWAEAGVSIAARGGRELFRSVYRLHRLRHRLRRDAHADHGIVRLAVFTPQRLGGREHAAEGDVPQDQAVAEAGEAGAAEVSRLSDETQKEAAVLPRPRE